MARWDAAKIKVCVHAKFYVPQSKGLSSVQFLEYLASHTHSKRHNHIVHRHGCQHDQYRPAPQSGEHKIFLAPCQSILNTVFIHIFFLSLLRKKKGGTKMGKKEEKSHV